MFRVSTSRLAIAAAASLRGRRPPSPPSSNLPARGRGGQAMKQSKASPALYIHLARAAGILLAQIDRSMCSHTHHQRVLPPSSSARSLLLLDELASYYTIRVCMCRSVNPRSHHAPSSIQHLYISSLFNFLSGGGGGGDCGVAVHTGVTR
jgi:hypothetical protein